jgi:hypothetical protein
LTIDLDVKALCWSFQLDTVTVSHRLKSDDPYGVGTDAETLG